MRISDWSSDVCSSDLRRHTAEVCLKQNRKVRGAKPHTEEQSAEGAAVAIADIRAERRMTLMDLSRRSGVAASTISRIENRQTSPTFTVLMKIAHGLSVPDRKSVVSGKRGSVRVDRGGRRIINKKKKMK